MGTDTTGVTPPARSRFEGVLTNDDLEEPGDARRYGEARAPQLKVASALVDLAQVSKARFHVTSSSPNLEIALASKNQRIPHRCRLKLFEVKPGQMAAFFYKTSAVPFSRDRFSYGAVSFSADELSDDELSGWLEYLASGFLWDRAPRRLQRALTFDVPD